ncbi:MAG: hypothetical protein GVY14_15710 [Spirochaetes bacterium]|jgi:uncharacterized glyoxalase superfamily protein PhnB|nr:hypothetical protein [Spirochaetota bacterium]
MTGDEAGFPGRPGFQTITPYVMVEKIDEYEAFLRDAFGATVTYKTTGAAGRTHLEVQIGTSRVMIGESPGGAGPAYLFVYVADVPALFDRAVECGASTMMKPERGMFQEEIGAAVTDPEGNTWFLAHHGPGSESP